MLLKNYFSEFIFKIKTDLRSCFSWMSDFHYLQTAMHLICHHLFVVCKVKLNLDMLDIISKHWCSCGSGGRGLPANQKASLCRHILGKDAEPRVDWLLEKVLRKKCSYECVCNWVNEACIMHCIKSSIRERICYSIYH